MKNIELTKDAEKDLREIAGYTLNKWGRKALQEYRDGLKDVFDEIGKRKITKRQFSDNFPEVQVARYRYHYIFYLTDSIAKPIIIGVIHERRDIVSRLAERLS